MNEDQAQATLILRQLQERAKELNCLYAVEAALRESDRPMIAMLRAVTEVLPAGWQYPELCQAHVEVDGLVAESANFNASEWTQSAVIQVNGAAKGIVEVSYRERMPEADEGPFLLEERKLIETVAERIGSLLAHRKMKSAFDSWAAAEQRVITSGEWRPITDFLRGTDPALLDRIARKLINHLSWSGVQEAKELLHRRVAPWDADRTRDENRPLDRNTQAVTLDLTSEAFRIADQHLSQSEILACITTWIKEEKSSFLVAALEHQDTPLGEIAEALEHFHNSGIDEQELSLATQKSLRVSLIRRFFSENPAFIDVAKHFIEIKDYKEILGSVVFPPRCHGKLGGKSAGLFLAKKIVEKAPEASEPLRQIKVPKTWYLTSDWILNFVHHNDLEDVLSRKHVEIDRVRQDYPHLVALFKNSSFPSELVKGLSLALDDVGDNPLIVRSSSLLEDRAGSAFSGKYKSLFLGNQGTKEERLAALVDAVAEVYASIFGPDPTEYRSERGLLDVHEEMGVMIQQVVGKKIGKYFLPACSGVAFSNNEFRWSSRIKRGDGLIRMVPGLGTRAVDRVVDDYPVLIAPGQPNLKANVTVDEVLRYSPKRVDVINLETNAFETVEVAALLAYCQSDYPQLRQLVSIVEHDRVEQPIGRLLDFASQEIVFTFAGLIEKTPFVSRIRSLLNLLQHYYRRPVDLEFAYDGQDFYLLQCRPQSFSTDALPVAIPQNLPADKVVFTAKRFVSNGRVPDISHVVYVDLEGYSQLPDEATMRQVGLAVGRLNKLLPKRQFILIGPGRWGSRGDIRLGVPVTYSDINNTAMLIEVAQQRGNYLPELSFGTHFFQDLVEAAIRYLPLYPDDPSCLFNELFLKRSHNLLAEMLPEFAHLADTLHIVDVPRETNGSVMRVLLNADLDQAVAFFAEPRHEKGEATADAHELPERAGEEHWRWRFRMVQSMAAQLDPKQFGVKAFYLIGSTKNATAGPGSDIDLLLHVDASDEQRKELLLWLDGWSRCLAEMNFVRTGYRCDGLLDVHLITDTDIDARTSFAVKIGAVTDAARKLPMRES
jgi:pyruvate, water dikinase